MADRDALIESEIPRLRRFARALTRDPDWADDLVQDCVERALSRWSTWRGGDSARAWLFTILHNLHANAVRRRARARAIFGHPVRPPEMATPPPQAGSLSLRDLDLALQRLPDDQRRAILLVGLEGLTYAEVASVTGVPMGTVMSRLSRGRERLRRLMAEGSNDGGPVLRRVK